MPSNNFIDLDIQASNHKIAILGECMIELSGKPLKPLQQGFSGDTLNTAIYLNRLKGGLPLDVCYATAIGYDAFSEQMLKTWKKEYLSCEYVMQIPDKNPGIYYIELDTKGERSFSYWRNDSAAKLYLEQDNSHLILEAIPQFKLLYISGISLAILPVSSRVKLLTAIKTMRLNGGKLAFDNNYRPLLWKNKEDAKKTYDTFMSECDLALLTFDDELLLREDITEDSLFNHCKELGISEVVIKRGPESCLIQTKNVFGSAHRLEIPANAVSTVVDTTAAGDSFSAAYLAARLHGLSPYDSASWGHSLASEVIQHKGAIIPLQHMPELKA